MKVKRIEHVAIAVRDLAESRVFWEDVLGLRLEHRETFPGVDVDVALYSLGSCMVELLCGTTSDSAYGRFIHERGESLHHLCFEVDDLDAALEELKAKGIRLRDEVPRAGHQGSRIAFLDPGSTGHVLIELVELRKEMEDKTLEAKSRSGKGPRH